MSVFVLVSRREPRYHGISVAKKPEKIHSRKLLQRTFPNLIRKIITSRFKWTIFLKVLFFAIFKAPKPKRAKFVICVFIGDVPVHLLAGHVQLDVQPGHLLRHEPKVPPRVRPGLLLLLRARPATVRRGQRHRRRRRDARRTRGRRGDGGGQQRRRKRISGGSAMQCAKKDFN